jgi:hypothetical protein
MLSTKERYHQRNLLVVHHLRKLPFKLKCQAGSETCLIQSGPLSSLDNFPKVRFSNKHSVL